MRSLAMVLVLVACDHRPASKPPPTPVPDDAAVGVEVACARVGAAMADVVIASATDSTQRAAYEQERGALVARFTQNCEQDAWPAASRACFVAATSAAELETCLRPADER